MAEPPVILRQLKPWDLDALTAASMALYRDEGVEPPSETALRIDLHRRLSSGSRGYLFLSPDIAGEPVAFALASGGRQARIEQFRVEPARRGSGWGRRCLQLLLDQTLVAAATVEVRVLADNAVGIAFWRALGFGQGRLRLEVMPRPTGFRRA